MTYIIAEPCINVKDRSCVDVCPVDCIYEGEDMLYIHPDECIDCGACEPECPVTAIFLGEDRRHGAFGLARAAVDALIRVDVQHVLALINAIHGTHVHAGPVLHVDAGFRDDVGHRTPQPGASAWTRVRGHNLDGRAPLGQRSAPPLYDRAAHCTARWVAPRSIDRPHGGVRRHRVQVTGLPLTSDESLEVLRK